jgi:hypothetical protein
LVAFLILFFAMILIIIALPGWGLLAAPLTKRREAQHVLPIAQSPEKIACKIGRKVRKRANPVRQFLSCFERLGKGSQQAPASISAHGSTTEAVGQKF